MPLIEDCSFETERLLARNWHDRSEQNWPPSELVYAVQAILTPTVTRSLPTGWQGEFSPDRAMDWIKERDAESTVLQVVERSSSRVIGLVLLGEESLENGDNEIRLGYMLAESAWGRGLATELIAGFVEWCRQLQARPVMTAGVGADNPASGRVLEKCGFARLADDGEYADGERVYRLDMR